MSLDDLMEVWRSQDAAPLHGVNETLLRLMLRQDEAKLQAQRRRETVFTYILSALLLALMAFWFVVMLDAKGIATVWDLFLPAIGAAATLYWAVALRMSRRAQAQREQGFGASLRDQLARRIAQLDYQVARALRPANFLAAWLPPFICLTAFLLIMMRANSEPNEPFDDWPTTLSTIVICAGSWVFSVQEQRRVVKRHLLPRKERLEALLKEVDGD